MAPTTGPGDVVAAARRAREVVAQALSPADGVGSVEEWAEAVGELQVLVDVATAAQDAAIVRLAAVEPELLDDGEVLESHRAPGHVALDAPAIVSGVLNLSAVAADRRVRQAVRVAADGPEGSTTCTGLGGLHRAMGDGRLDAYRAGVVAHELEEVPAEVAAAVVGALDAFLDREDAARLRRRVRRALAAISPDLLRQRAVRARSESSLRRWVDEPGVDTWLGTFPSEEACAAWGAIDELAQRYVADGTCERIDRARAKALTDLVLSNATVDLRVVLAVPAGSPEAPVVAGTAPADLVPVIGPAAGEPVLAERAWLERAVAATTCRADRRGRPVVSCDPTTGALLDVDDELATDAYRPGTRLARLVRDRDGHCRFPGCHVAARFCDLDHVVPYPAGATSARNLVCLCRRHHRIKQRPGWRARLDPDGTMTWTDPTGRVRTTAARDHRGATLPDRGADRPPPPTNHALALPDAPHSALEHHLEHHPPPRPWHLEYQFRDGHRSRRCVSPSGDPPF
jgi:hypothetical protein